MSMKLRNIMEDMVLEKIDSIINSLGCCTCEKCKADIAAYVLNRVKPKYVVTDKGALFSKTSELNRASDTDLLMKIVEASEQVKQNPRHEK